MMMKVYGKSATLFGEYYHTKVKELCLSYYFPKNSQMSRIMKPQQQQQTWIGYCSNTDYDRRFRCEDNNVAFANVQPHYHRVRQVEPCHHLG